jgi:hypothetical protein
MTQWFNIFATGGGTYDVLDVVEPIIARGATLDVVGFLDDTTPVDSPCARHHHRAEKKVTYSNQAAQPPFLSRAAIGNSAVLHLQFPNMIERRRALLICCSRARARTTDTR